MAVLLVVLVLVAVVAYAPRSSPLINVDSTGISDNGQKGTTPTTPTDPIKVPPIPADGSDKTLTAGNTTAYFIDVGQGDSELIHTSDDKNILIDAGPKGAGSMVVGFLRSHNVTTLDAFIVTHPHEDHIGGGEDVLRSCTVRAIYQTGQTTDTETYNEFEMAARAEGCPIYTGATLKAGDHLNLSSNVTFRLMAMDSSYEDMNDASLVIKMTDGMVDFLLMGDATEDVENLMDRTYGTAMDVEILKVGHHGSRWSSSMEFLRKTTPAVAVIEVGGDNNYGHPTNATLGRLVAVGSEVLRTDLNGTITVTTDGTDWKVSTSK